MRPLKGLTITTDYQWLVGEGITVPAILRDELERAGHLELTFSPMLSCTNDCCRKSALHEGVRPKRFWRNRRLSTRQCSIIELRPNERNDNIEAIFDLDKISKTNHTSVHGFELGFQAWKFLFGDTRVSEVTIDMVDEYVELYNDC